MLPFVNISCSLKSYLTAQYFEKKFFSGGMNHSKNSLFTYLLAPFFNEEKSNTITIFVTKLINELKSMF